MKWKTTIYHTLGTILQSNRKILEKGKLYTSLSVICASFLWSVPIDKAKVDVLGHIWNLSGQFIIWHALTNAEGYVLWHYHARPMSVVPNENNVTLLREIYRKMGLFELKYSIKFEKKNWHSSHCFHGKFILIKLQLGEISTGKSSVPMWKSTKMHEA
jgi:hypothetical protein